MRDALIRGGVWLYRFQTLTIANWLYRGAPAETVVEVPFAGYTLPVEVARTTMHRLLALLRERQVVERGLLARLIRPGDCVGDVGANIGYYALLFARLAGPSGRVVCLEPEPDNLVQLRRIVERNALPNVEVLPVAAGEQPGQVQLERGMNGHVKLEGDFGCVVPVIALDSLADRRFDVVKIDVEGFEGQVLGGMRQLLQTRPPRLFVEVHPALLRYGYTVRDVFELVQPHYRTIEFWAEAGGPSVWDKVRTRYVPGAAVTRLPDAPTLLAACERGERTTPFWMICT